MFQSVHIVHETVEVEREEGAREGVQQGGGSCLAIECLQITETAPSRQSLVQSSDIEALSLDVHLRISGVRVELHIEFLGDLLTQPGLSTGDVSIDKDDLGVVVEPLPCVVKELVELVVPARFVGPRRVLSFCRLSVGRTQQRDLSRAWQVYALCTAPKHEQKLTGIRFDGCDGSVK